MPGGIEEVRRLALSLVAQGDQIEAHTKGLLAEQAAVLKQCRQAILALRAENDRLRAENDRLRKLFGEDTDAATPRT